MREKEFLDFNIDNIFVNFYQTEDHLRRLRTTENKAGHASCVFKHLSFISGELGEAISHSSVVAPALTPVFQKMQRETDALRHGLSELSVSEAIDRVRSLRKIVERINPKYDTSQCKACSKIEKTISKKIEKGGSNMKKEFTTIIASQFVGKGIQEGAGYVDKIAHMETNAVYARPSAWINVVGGLGGILAGLYLLEDNPKLQLASVVVGSNLLTKTIDYAKEIKK